MEKVKEHSSREEKRRVMINTEYNISQISSCCPRFVLLWVVKGKGMILRHVRLYEHDVT